MDRVLHGAFDEALRRRGFQRMSRRKWVRSSKVPIREVFEFFIGKTPTPRWGFSLDYVPHVFHAFNSEVRWHPSDEAAIMDLSYNPIDYEKTGTKGWLVTPLYGETRAMQGAESVRARSLELALPFFEQVIDVRDLPAQFAAKRRRKFVRFGFQDYTQEQLAYAFTLAKLGRESEGRQWMAFFKQRYWRLPKRTSRELDRHFDRLAGGPEG